VYIHGAGLLDGHGMQLVIQLASSVISAIFSFSITYLILRLFGCFSQYGDLWLSFLGLRASMAERIADLFRLRVSSEEELAGIDDTNIGEFAVCLTTPNTNGRR
jgi:ammonia channel protein AmtB